MKNRKGKNNNFYGKKHTERSRLKMSKSHLGVKLTTEHKIKIGKGNLGNKKTDIDKQGCRVRMLKLHKEDKLKMRGERHWNWKGGVSPLNRKLRTSSFWKKWRESIFLRDNFTCQNYNCSFCENKIGVLLHPHHIKPLTLYPELVFDINNGITYCAEFHLKSELHKNSLKTNLKLNKMGGKTDV